MYFDFLHFEHSVLLWAGLIARQLRQVQFFGAFSSVSKKKDSTILVIFNQ